jgi:hypothetical protein
LLATRKELGQETNEERSLVADVPRARFFGGRFEIKLNFHSLFGVRTTDAPHLEEKVVIIVYIVVIS